MQMGVQRYGQLTEEVRVAPSPWPTRPNVRFASHEVTAGAMKVRHPTTVRGAPTMGGGEGGGGK
jgi:hypothetical protein